MHISASLSFARKEGSHTISKAMADHQHHPFLIIFAFVILFSSATEAADIFLEWDVAFNWDIKPVGTDQPV